MGDVLWCLTGCGCCRSSERVSAEEAHRVPSGLARFGGRELRRRISRVSAASHTHTQFMARFSVPGKPTLDKRKAISALVQSNAFGQRAEILKNYDDVLNNAISLFETEDFQVLLKKAVDGDLGCYKTYAVMKEFFESSGYGLLRGNDERKQAKVRTGLLKLETHLRAGFNFKMNYIDQMDKGWVNVPFSVSDDLHEGNEEIRNNNKIINKLDYELPEYGDNKLITNYDIARYLLLMEDTFRFLLDVLKNSYTQMKSPRAGRTGGLMRRRRTGRRSERSPAVRSPAVAGDAGIKRRSPAVAQGRRGYLTLQQKSEIKAKVAKELRKLDHENPVITEVDASNARDNVFEMATRVFCSGRRNLPAREVKAHTKLCLIDELMKEGTDTALYALGVELKLEEIHGKRQRRDERKGRVSNDRTDRRSRRDKILRKTARFGVDDDDSDATSSSSSPVPYG